MFRCIICRFEVTLDDVVLNKGDGRCVCLRCYNHETHHETAVSKRLQRDTDDGEGATV
jgi:hypothetical protein